MAQHKFIANMDPKELKALQHDLNRFIKRTGIDWEPLREDGKPGRLTRRRIRYVKGLLGFSPKYRNTEVTKYFRWRLTHPFYIRKDKNGHKRDSDRQHVFQGKQNRKAMRKHIKDLHAAASSAPGIKYYDGKPVYQGVVDVLDWCRHNGWHGIVVSGYRTPEYSEGLCITMCGHTSCPGRCAGRATNHAYKQEDRFALDLSDYITFGRVIARCPLKPHIHNSLPNDRVHYSPSGR